MLVHGIVKKNNYKKNVKILIFAMLTATWRKHKNLIFYGNRIISIQKGTKRTVTYTRVASNIHKDLITPHIGLAIRF